MSTDSSPLATTSNEDSIKSQVNTNGSSLSSQLQTTNSDDDREYYYGCGPCHPRFMQILFRRKKFFTFLLCTFSFLQSGLISGLISVVISTIERRYNFTSTQAGVIIIMYDISAITGVIFVSYFGSRTHRPRLLGIATILMGFGALVFASPQFILERYDATSTAGSELSGREQCLDGRLDNNENCSNANSVAFILFIASNIILGLSVTPLYTNGVAFLDEIVYPRFVSLHVGLVSTMLITAPLVGLGFGSVFLSLYVDPWLSTSLTEDDPTWVGAWWIPFLIVSAFLFLLSIPFFMYPRYLPDSHLIQKERANEMAKVYSSKYANENSLTITFKMFPVHIKQLLLNPSFLFIVLGLCSVYIFLQGVVSFGPKYYEVQYRFTPSMAGLIAGGIGIPGAILGTLTGAFVVFGCKMKGRSNTLFMSITLIVTMFICLLFLLHCPETKVAGITVPYTERSQEECVRQCNCTLNVFEPVCGSDDLTYFSPCQAGCVTSGSTGYENCSCIVEGTLYSNSSTNATVLEGYCKSNCLLIIISAVVLLALMIFTAFLNALPYLHSIIRVVADEQRALALGVQSAMTRVLGTVPGPLIFGAIFDVSCASWQEKCGRRGNCWIYDSKQLSRYAISLALPCTFLGALFFFLAWLTYPKRKHDDKDNIVMTVS